MAYPRPPDAFFEWDRPGRFQGVNIYQEISGQQYAWRIPYNGLVTQALAADLLGVSTMAVNNWVRADKMYAVEIPGQPSAIPLSVVKEFRQHLAVGGGRLPPGV